MRRQVGRELRRRFDEALRRLDPGWHKVIGAEIPSGDVLYESCRPNDRSVCAYVLLVPHLKRDWFTVECGWSRDGQFPTFARPETPEETIERGAGRFRLHWLWSDPGTDWWWQVEEEQSLEDEIQRLLQFQEQPLEEAIPRVGELVEDAVAKLQQYAFPFFSRVFAAER